MEQSWGDHTDLGVAHGAACPQAGQFNSGALSSETRLDSVHGFFFSLSLSNTVEDLKKNQPIWGCQSGFQF